MDSLHGPPEKKQRKVMINLTALWRAWKKYRKRKLKRK